MFGKPVQFLVQIDGGDRFLLFNGVTAGLVSFDREVFERAQEIMTAADDGGDMPEDEAGRNVYTTLVNGRFIVPKSVDELALLKVPAIAIFLKLLLPSFSNR